MRKFYGLAVLVCLVSCSITSYDGSIKIVNHSGIELHDVTYSGNPIEFEKVYTYQPGSSGAIECKTPSGYLYRFPIVVSISIRENYLITIYGSGEMREGVPTLYALMQIY